MEAAMRVESNEDLLLEVLKHLNGKSLAISACVSRQWKRAAETESLWENICARNWHFGQLYSRQLRSVVPAMGGCRRLYLISRPLRATERNGNDDDNNNNNKKKKKNYGQRSENRLSCRPRCCKDEGNFSALRRRLAFSANPPRTTRPGGFLKKFNAVVLINPCDCGELFDTCNRIFGIYVSSGCRHRYRKNTAPSPLPGAQGMQAVALRVSGDKAVFISCHMLGSQDTLFDHSGRHYFWNSYIEGSIDFIFGNARSLYEGCLLHANAASYGAIAASQRNSPRENSGFSFLDCKLRGSGILYLGRAWGRYARIVYAYCHFDNIIIPQGWYDWGDPSRRRTVLFGEYKCNGGGADSQGRVSWARRLSYDEAKPFLGRNFIDGGEWLRL